MPSRPGHRRDVGRRLAWAVHQLVMTYDVGRVVLGGGVSHAGEAFAASDRARARRGCARHPTLARELLPADVVELLPAGGRGRGLGCRRRRARAAPRPATGGRSSSATGEEVGRHEPRHDPIQRHARSERHETRTPRSKSRGRTEEERRSTKIAKRLSPSDWRRCSPSAPAAPRPRRQPAAAAGATGGDHRPAHRARSAERVGRRRQRRPPLAGGSGRSGHRGRRANAEIGFWTFYLSPTFDQYIKDTIARFEAAYPGVKVNWEDHQAHLPGRPPQRVRRRQRARTSSTCPSARAGSASTPRKDLLLEPDDNVPQEVKDKYFPGLWNSSWSTARTSSSRGTRASASS